MQIPYGHHRLITNQKFVMYLIIKFVLFVFSELNLFCLIFQQELTAKILHLENPVRFINISKEGYLGLWTPNLNLEKTYSAADELDDGGNSISGNGQGRRRAGMWITDAIYMTDAHKLALASTSRDLRFFTISSETFLEEFTLFGKYHRETTELNSIISKV